MFDVNIPNEVPAATGPNAFAMESSHDQPALAQWAQLVLGEQVERAGAALERYGRRPRSAKRLHDARRCLAALRAALEDLGLLAGVSAGFRERVDELHRRAGKVRDADALRRRIDSYREDAFGRECAQLCVLDASLRKRGKKARRKLRRAIAQAGSGLAQ